MSEPYLSTRSKICMHLKRFKVFSSLRRPETHFRHAQGHQRAGALTGSINIIQSTIITLYEVEHQKTVNTKLGKQTIWFSEVIKDIYQYFDKKYAGRQKRQKVKLHCFPKAYQSILQNHMAKNYTVKLVPLLHQFLDSICLSFLCSPIRSILKFFPL